MDYNNNIYNQGDENNKNIENLQPAEDENTELTETQKKNLIYDEFRKTNYSIVKALVLMWLLSNILVAIASIVTNQIGPEYFLYTTIASFITYVLCYIIFLKKDQYPRSWEQKDSKLKTLLIGLGLMILANIVVSLLSSILNEGFGTESIDAEFLSSNNLFMDVITIGILPGLGEELFFRGIIYRYLRKFNSKVAIIGSALIFGLIHMNLTQGIFAFFAGILLATAYERTGSLLVPIMMHMLNNSLAVLGLEYDIISWILFALALVSLIYLIYYLITKRNNPSENINEDKFDKELFKKFIRNPGIFFFMAYCVITIGIMISAGIL